MRYFYWSMMGLGIALPYSQFVPWSLSGGSVGDILPLSFANHISGGIALDALTAGVFLVGFMIADRKRVRVKNFWVPIAGIFLFGIAFAFPCYFYLREKGSTIHVQK